MSARAVRLIGYALTAGWVAILGLLLSLLVATNAAPALGRAISVIHGSSMEPTIPLGALLIDEPVDPTSIAVGDIVTFRAGNGIAVTYRVNRIVGGGDALRFEMSGDANATPDPVLIEGSAILGRTEFQVPLVGYALAIAATPSGLVSILALLGALLAAGWLLDELRPGASRDRHLQPVVSDEPRPA